MISKESIIKECKNMQADLQVSVSEDPSELSEYGNIIVVHMARSGKLLADAKYMRDLKVNETILNNKESGLPASIFSKLIDSECKEENYLVNWLDRINRNCVHRLDWCRTLISKAKEEMKFGQFQT